MINVIKYPERKEWQEITKRPVMENASLNKTVRKILAKVKEKGDRAVRKYTKEFDGVKLKKLGVSEKEIKSAEGKLSQQLKDAIKQAKTNIEKFHRSQVDEVKIIETMPGINCWRKSVSIEKIGIYIPGGSAPLFSTVLMLVVPAVIAGCKEIVVCSPPAKDGTINPAILYAANLRGVTKIFKVGGVQAIGAMAYGTETIPKVFKLFGPGNQFVTAAKQIIQREGVAIDMPAGPSEVLVIADETAIPEFVAADLLSQAEHGEDSQAILLTISETIGLEVQRCIKQQLQELPRKEIAKKALANSKIVLLNSIEEAIELSNFYAPEHLILSSSNAEELTGKIISAGSVFIGNYSPESVGDYASGTNHTLPTNGYAAMYSGISVDSFVKKLTFQQLSKEGLENVGNTVMEMASAEGLVAHKNAVAIRLKK